MTYLRLILLFFCSSFSSLAYSQLADFNLNVVTTDETCTNNGALQINVSNAVPNSQISYKLFLAPGYVNPIAETSGNSFSGLSAGTYKVVATQSLNGQQGVKEKVVVIKNLKEVLDFEISDSSVSACDVSASLIVTVTSGNPTLYEIIAGPITRPLQTSNQFLNLIAGSYVVRVFDGCNDAISKSYILKLANNDLKISAPVLPEIYTSCDSMEIINNISSNSGAAIMYPLIVKYSVIAPDNSVAQMFTQTINSGASDVLQMFQTISTFGNSPFKVNIEVTDNCNNVFTEEFTINPSPKLSVQKEKAECGELYFTLKVINFLPPFTLNFEQPVGFDASVFNAAYPGPFMESSITFGSMNQTVPFGDYKVSVEDGCGRKRSLNFSLVDEIVQPSVRALNNGCGSLFGSIRIQIPSGRKILSITMISAPLNYPAVLPQDVTSNVDVNGVYYKTNLPIGQYKFFVTDNCGDTYTVSAEILPFVFGPLKALTRPSCSPIKGGVQLSTTNGKLVTVKITSAPPTFSEPLPYDVSFNINANGLFYMTDLPLGNYSFVAKDACGFDLSATVEILGYNSSSDGLYLNRKCGSFDIKLSDTDESITGKTFWLQMYFENTNTWGNPYTGAPYIEGEIPNNITAKELLNSGTLVNIFLVGKFRILKVFDTFSNGSSAGKCLDLYAEFRVASELVIKGVYNLNCNGAAGVNDVVIDVEGVQPLSFNITSPYMVENGDNNIFQNLAPGVYNFQVTDNCGNIKNITVEVGTLLPLAKANKPANMQVCREDGLEFGIFPLINQKSQILGNQNPNDYIVTFHVTSADAEAGVNPLPAGYTNLSNPQTIYVRVEHKTLKLCYATTDFTIYAGIKPKLFPVAPIVLCENFTKELIADAGFDVYEWSTGEVTQSIIVSQPGIYTVTVRNLYQDFSCDASKDFEVLGSSAPVILSINTSDWSQNNNSVVVSVSGSGDYLYSVDGVNYQSSNTFTGLLPGVYTVYVKDNNGCGNVKGNFFLLNYSKYFTPNGDGFNDTWNVEYSSKEPNLNAKIFDRFGKFIIQLKGGEVGWDGTYNGYDLPASDYWFVVTREDGQIYRGHFSLKR